MRVLIISIAALIATPAIAQDGPSIPVAEANSDKKICKRIGETGSRVGKRKVCATQREWDESRRKASDFTRGIQTRAGQSGMPAGN